MFLSVQLAVPAVTLGYSSSDLGVPPSVSLYCTMQPPLATTTRQCESAVLGEHEDLTRHAARCCS